MLLDLINDEVLGLARDHWSVQSRMLLATDRFDSLVSPLFQPLLHLSMELSNGVLRMPFHIKLRWRVVKLANLLELAVH